MSRWTRSAAAMAALLAAWFFTGCGPPPNVTVTGTVLQGAKPLGLSPTGVVQITLVPDVPPGADYTSYMGRCDEAGKFEVVDVPPGRYKVCIEQLDPTPQDDKLQGAYSMHNTKFIREIDGKTPIDIDLAKPAP